MPRITRSDWIPKLGRHKATEQAIVKIDGRVVYLGVHGSAATDAAYQAIVGEWLLRKAGKTAAIAKPEGAVVGSSITITELCVEYVRFAEGSRTDVPRALAGAGVPGFKARRRRQPTVGRNRGRT
jgi:hypothetical protein